MSACACKSCELCTRRAVRLDVLRKLDAARNAIAWYVLTAADAAEAERIRGVWPDFIDAVIAFEAVTLPPDERR